MVKKDEMMYVPILETLQNLLQHEKVTAEVNVLM